MSKIGQMPIPIPASVTVKVENQQITVSGKNGQIQQTLPACLTIVKHDDRLEIRRSNDKKQTKSLHGLFRNLVRNAVVGVETLFEKRLEIIGTGYNAKMQNEDIVLKVGYSHPIIFKKAAGVQFKVEGNNIIVVSGIDKQLVGQVAHQIKLIKKPDPYKGKGIRYEGERLRIKPGKKAKAAGAVA